METGFLLGNLEGFHLLILEAIHSDSMLPMFLSHHPIPGVQEEASGRVLQRQLLRALLGIQIPRAKDSLGAQRSG